MYLAVLFAPYFSYFSDYYFPKKQGWLVGFLSWHIKFLDFYSNIQEQLHKQVAPKISRWYECHFLLYESALSLLKKQGYDCHT